MSEHKFEPFDRVLVRDEDGENWCCDFFSHKDGYRFYTVSAWFNQIIPYNENTKHLIGTTESYEPPKPPHEYKWGDKVEANYDGTWQPAIFIRAYDFEVVTVLPNGCDGLFHCPYEFIRPAAPTP